MRGNSPAAGAGEGRNNHGAGRFGAAMKRKTIRKALAAGRPLHQIAALPYRDRPEGREFLLITSRRSRRLIVPKGWPMRRRKDWQAAEIEALEEAGITGRIGHAACGSFRYMKDLERVSVPVTVAVYPLLVEDLRPDWKERASRRRIWLPRSAAVRAVREPDLARLLARF